MHCELFLQNTSEHNKPLNLQPKQTVVEGNAEQCQGDISKTMRNQNLGGEQMANLGCAGEEMANLGAGAVEKIANLGGGGEQMADLGGCAGGKNGSLALH